jgi:hypothetical protein
MRVPGTMHFIIVAFLIATVYSSLGSQSTTPQEPKVEHFFGKGPWRSVDFANFTLNKTCLGGDARIVNGLASRVRDGEQWTLSVLAVDYTDMTGDGREDAVVHTICEFPAANPGAYPHDIHIYEVAGGGTTLVTKFEPPRPDAKDLPPGIWEADLIILEVNSGAISVERFAGEARCCPTLYVRRTYKWRGSKWVQVGFETRPYEKR